jgi:hypothetical protein
MDHQNQLLKWENVIAYGELVFLKTKDVEEEELDPNWKSKSGLVTYRKGYLAKRSYFDNAADVNYTIIFGIKASSLNKCMLFTSEILLSDKIVISNCCSTSTASVKKVFLHFDISFKGRIVGNSYFGLLYQ